MKKEEMYRSRNQRKSKHFHVRIVYFQEKLSIKTFTIDEIFESHIVEIMYKKTHNQLSTQKLTNIKDAKQLIEM